MRLKALIASADVRSNNAQPEQVVRAWISRTAEDGELSCTSKRPQRKGDVSDVNVRHRLGVVDGQ